MKIITESDMKFGKFDEANLFHIEDSKIYKDLGSGVKTVEFILRHNENSIVFLEAKKSCPNAENRYESEEKTKKFEEYYSSIVDKFVASLQIYLASILNIYSDISEIGENLRNVTDISGLKLKFILVIKHTKDITWLAGPMAELKARLLSLRRIWGVEVVVLNEELARESKLVCG